MRRRRGRFGFRSRITKRELLWVRDPVQVLTSNTAVRIVEESDWARTTGGGIEKGAVLQRIFLSWATEAQAVSGLVGLPPLMCVFKCDQEQSLNITEAATFLEEDLLWEGYLPIQAMAVTQEAAGNDFVASGKLDIRVKRKLTSNQDIRVVAALAPAGSLSIRTSCLVSLP